MLVLGIDPGTRFVGYGVVHIEGNRYRAVDYGYFKVDSKSAFPMRLKQIHEDVSTLIDKVKPDAVAVEEVFVSQNAKTTLKLGHARGVILLAAVHRDLAIAEYAPREIKQAVSGRGGATKEQVQWMMTQILGLPKEPLQADAADGLAVALCHGLRSSGAASMLRKAR